MEQIKDVTEKDLIEYVETVLFAVTDDADNNDGKVDRAALYEMSKTMLKKLGREKNAKEEMPSTVHQGPETQQEGQ